MISKDISRICRNYTKIENYEQAVEDTTQTWHCHHKREITENKTSKQLDQEGLYFNRPPEELIFLTEKEHHSIHSTGRKQTEETKAKLSDIAKRRKLCEETKAKIGETQRKLYKIKLVYRELSRRK